MNPSQVLFLLAALSLPAHGQDSAPPTGLGLQPGPLAAVLIGASADGAMRRGNEPSLSRNTPRTPEQIAALPPHVACGFGTGPLLSAWQLGDMRLHVEWLSPAGDKGQNAGNSGVYIQDLYEVQILATPSPADGGPMRPAHNEAGALYRFKAASINASAGAGAWQAYDIWFTAPRFTRGVKTSDARITVYWNGFLIHDRVTLPHPTGARKAGGEPGPPSGTGVQTGFLRLQEHTSKGEDPVLFRNVWAEPLSPNNYAPDSSADWIDLLHTEDWVSRGGSAAFEIKDGVLTGESRPNTPNTFYTSTREFSDFELEFDFRQDVTLNSGVQIRSEVVGGFQNRKGGLKGYQVELDPSARSYTAGIYEEHGRAWLTPLIDNPEARAAYRSAEWNHVRVLATGDLIRTWINGVPAARLLDAASARGHIAMQVHGVGAATEPKRVKWRNMRLRELKPAKSVRYQMEFPPGIDRDWIGPGFHGNRLQDWRLAAGRLECQQSSKTKPNRVLHALDAAVTGLGPSLDLTVNLGTLDSGPLPGPNTWAGFLLGAGGPDIDYRLTALVHHRPATDGGLIAAIDGDGRAVFRDFEHNERAGNWGITGELDPRECLPLPLQQQSGEGYGTKIPDAVHLHLNAERFDDTWTLTLVASDADDGRELSRSRLAFVAPRFVTGSLALCSHRGPEGGRLGYWFDDYVATGDALELFPERTFGPFWTAQYTLSRGTLKLTAQLPPLGEGFNASVQLDLLQEDGQWRQVASARYQRPSNTALFRLDNQTGTEAIPYRLRVQIPTGPDTSRPYNWHGTLRPEPTNGEFVLAAFTGNKHFTGGIHWNSNGVWFPHTELTSAIQVHDPDLLFFSGDQIYEGDLTGAQRRPLPTAMLDYHDKWLRWCWAFQDLVRDRPTICIPDDHDVYHGNLWGAGGRAARRPDDGGYTMPADFVRMVERTQTSHLPDPYDPTPVEQGIGVYYTDLQYGGISFAILEDRKFKSSATPTVPEGNVVNGWFQNPDFDPATSADVPGAVLLGERQLAFLNDWSTDWSDGTWMKVCLSQTIFANVATLPAKDTSDAVVPGLQLPAPGEYPTGDKPVADCDSNGWPQTGRNRALRELRRGFAFHIAGDQHLGSFISYGIDSWNDSGYAFCVPSIANTFPRRWFPPTTGANHVPGEPNYTGEYLDGFGNHMTVHAVSNPSLTRHEPTALHNRAPGYGIVRFHRERRDITVECWPRWSDPRRRALQQYTGWPQVVQQQHGYAPEPLGFLPKIEITGAETPVVQVVKEETGEIVYALRLAAPEFHAPVYEPGAYSLRVGEPGRWTVLTGLRVSKSNDVTHVKLAE